jgi:polyphenol oxidase
MTNISQGRNLSLQKCIIKQLINKGVILHNITKLDICTYCNQTYSLYSYRKNKEYSGRMFSFIFMK